MLMALVEQHFKTFFDLCFPSEEYKFKGNLEETFGNKKQLSVVFCCHINSMSYFAYILG